MQELTQITPDMVGAKVRSVARPEWGVGEILLVKPETVNGQPVHRVSIQFSVGHKTLMVPPAKLIEAKNAPPPPPKQPGWIDTVAKATPEDQLRALPHDVTHVLGSFEQRVLLVSQLYQFDDGDEGLLKWARAQTKLPDPLEKWSRDELAQAFGDFRRARDAFLRKLVDDAKKKRGAAAVGDALLAVPVHLRDRVRAVM